MRVSRRVAVFALPVAVALAASGVSAQQAPVTDYAALDVRLQHLERLLESQSLVRLLESVEALKKEIRDLRGELEVQGHGVAQLKQRQRELYLDVDRRLERMEVAGVPAAGAAPGAQPAYQPGVVAQLPSDAQAGVVAGVGVAGAAPTASGQEARQPAVAAGVQSVAATAVGRAAVAVAPVAGQAAPGATSGTGAAQTTRTAAATPIADPFEEQQAYQTAFNLLKAGRYESAATSFQEFLVGYPQGKYADNAQYWLAETYYVTRKFDAALQEFRALVSTYPTSQKLTHALLKIGYIQGELGNNDDAQRVLGDLVAHHPNTTAAGLARKRLQRLRASQ